MTGPSRMRGARAGFTLLEMLIVIGIILALGALVLVNVMGAGEKADVKLARAQIDGFARAMEHFKADMKRWPSEEEGLAALWNREAIQDDDERAKWGGPYLSDAKPKDTWSSEWIYHQPSQLLEGAAYDIMSPGPDKQEGTADDITNQDSKTSSEGADGDFSDFTPSKPVGG